MATPMITPQWARFVLPIVRREWYLQMQTVQSPALGMFGVESSTSSVEYSQGVGNFGTIPEYNSISGSDGQPAAIRYDNFNPLYETTFTHKEYALGVAIERKLWDDDQMSLIRRRAQSLGLSFGTTRAEHAASVFNNAFSASYVGADSVALCSDSHPNRPDDTSTTHDNNGTSPLSYDAVVDTIQAGRELTNDRGNPLPTRYSLLYVPVELEKEAWVIVNTLRGEPGTANNDANYVAGQGMRVVVDPYLTDANNWFMIDPAQAQMHLLWFNRVNPELEMDPSGDYNLVARYRGYMRYSFGWDDWRWVYGHEVS